MNQVVEAKYIFYDIESFEIYFNIIQQLPRRVREIMSVMDFSDFNKIHSVLTRLDLIYGEESCDYFVDEFNYDNVNRNVFCTDNEVELIVDNFASGCCLNNEVHLSQVFGNENKAFSNSLIESLKENESFNCNNNDMIYDYSNEKLVGVSSNETKRVNENRSNLTVKFKNFNGFFLFICYKKLLPFSLN